jgi:hypothetical protein
MRMRDPDTYQCSNNEIGLLVAIFPHKLSNESLSGIECDKPGVRMNEISRAITEWRWFSSGCSKKCNGKTLKIGERTK